jgi:hypothetical protein
MGLLRRPNLAGEHRKGRDLGFSLFFVDTQVINSVRDLPHLT